MALFESEIKYVGKHATYCRFLKDQGVFSTYREAYLISALVGFLNGTKSPVDRPDKDNKVQEASIFSSDIAKMKSDFTYLYRIIMLLDENPVFTIDDYISRTFKDDVDEENRERVNENMKLFDSYARGGIEILYDLFKDCNEKDELADKLFEYISSFAEECGIE